MNKDIESAYFVFTGRRRQIMLKPFSQRNYVMQEHN